MKWTLGLAVIVSLLVGCSSDAPRMPTQMWQDLDVTVETRPPHVAKGMNEFLVIASFDGRKPAHDLIVSIQMLGDPKWYQAIQDGHVGVYRRAIFVRDPNAGVLLVQLQRGEEKGMLEFPLKLQKTASPDS